MSEVKIRNNKSFSNIEGSIRILKRKMIAEGIFKELKKRKYAMKPSLAKRVKRENAEKQRHKDYKRQRKINRNLL